MSTPEPSLQVHQASFAFGGVQALRAAGWLLAAGSSPIGGKVIDDRWPLS